MEVEEVSVKDKEGAVEGKAKGGIGSGDGEGSEKTRRKTGAHPENMLEAALLQMTGEAAAKKREEDQKEKEYSSMTDKLDLAVSLNGL